MALKGVGSCAGRERGVAESDLSAGPYLTVREVAERLRVSTATVYEAVRLGEMPHVRVSNSIRIPASAIG